MASHAATLHRFPDPVATPTEAELTLSANAETVLARRYLARDAAGNIIERPSELFHRVARVVASAETAHGGDAAATERAFYDLMARRAFLPNSPALMNAGQPLGQLAACFVVPVDDSMPAIFDAVKWAAMIQMSGGGTGFAFSRLRPAGDHVATTGGAASGPVPFMDIFNSATDTIVQGGRRRGANMGILRVDHPDIVEFIRAKLDPRRLTNFNLSVAITDDFMRAVAADADYALINPRTGLATRQLHARTVFRLISNLAWQSGEPGVVFIDRINAAHPARHIGVIESTNPCGEQPLLPFESCVLGSLNLAAFVTDGARDEAALADATHLGVRFLDDLIDASRYPLPQIEAITRANRKLGLGVMGFADLLIALGIPYDSDQAIATADHVMGLVERESVAASRALARTRGAFPNYRGSSWDTSGAAPMRNATTTTVAPTGTISIIAGCSSGIEPLFAVSYVRTVLEGTRLTEVHPGFRALAEARGFASPDLMSRLADRGRVRGLPTSDVPADVQALFATAHDVSPEQHVRMQAAFQRHVHSSVSKTINLPASSTPEDVARIYDLAYALDCKGVTVYRDGSREAQVLSFGGDAASATETTTTEALPPDGGCPECGHALFHGRGCLVCESCGWSRCG
ncbi:MAG: adenosylcobalamin-dependent ribonucleoside-diphosphate reductase [Deltaproteobacteria bacterium]|nr:adenosylcobalamin-dependent ribonucleoside-diphosphate reductase [Deltaproteobacteria bacterium]